MENFPIFDIIAELKEEHKCSGKPHPNLIKQLFGAYICDFCGKEYYPTVREDIHRYDVFGPFGE